MDFGEIEPGIGEALDIVSNVERDTSGKSMKKQTPRPKQIDERIAERTERGLPNMVDKSAESVSKPLETVAGGGNPVEPPLGPIKTIELGEVVKDKITEDSGVNLTEND